MMTKTLESELFRRRFDDGALDLFAGLAIFSIGIGWMFDIVVLAAIMPAVFWPFWAVVHKRIVVPRLGEVEFSEARKAKISTTYIALLILGTVSFLFGLIAFALVEGWIDSVQEIAVPLILLVPSLVMAFAAVIGFLMLGAMRMLVYAAVFVASGVLMQIVLPYHPGHSLALGGALPLLCGVVMLIRFLRAYPVLDEG
ncbi:hypothetical protein [Maricaulis sp.]|uniref:hypothetical protein n=1 Tax=Maricaulis sp. TaxID=1486257 RepID=UPI00260D6D2E|nr:hypothetical protein [Maricaulis sp.]